MSVAAQAKARRKAHLVERRGKFSIGRKTSATSAANLLAMAAPKKAAKMGHRSK